MLLADSLFAAYKKLTCFPFRYFSKSNNQYPSSIELATDSLLCNVLPFTCLDCAGASYSSELRFRD